MTSLQLPLYQHDDVAAFFLLALSTTFSSLLFLTVTSSYLLFTSPIYGTNNDSPSRWHRNLVVFEPDGHDNSDGMKH